MAYVIGSTTVVNDSAQINYSQIVSRPTMCQIYAYYGNGILHGGNIYITGETLVIVPG
jgi:hypothetical protein